MTDLLSSSLFTIAVFFVIPRTLPGYQIIYFQRSAWSSSPRKEEERGGEEGCRGLAREAGHSWLLLESFVSRLEGLVLITACLQASALYWAWQVIWRTAESRPTSPVGYEHGTGKSLKVVSKLEPENQKRPRNRERCPVCSQWIRKSKQVGRAGIMSLVAASK